MLYSFKGPAAPTFVNGTLYGTTDYGGTASAGNGTVFELSASGKERVVYRFQGGTDGATPAGAVILVNRTLYGTTYFGGNGASSGRGDGTIFKISP